MARPGLRRGAAGAGNGCSGTQFDPVMVEAFLRALESCGWESEAELREAAGSAARPGT
ncbi:hypothetical protein [Actinomadura sp. 3N407]|uniref:hypothetical protein n=1 Tax=Actinomadura sp. 3N407 TaxID=3457423 RepID=UPI003FCD1A94